MRCFDECIEIAMKEFLTKFYQGVYEYQTWVMRDFIFRSLRQNEEGEQILSVENFYKILALAMQDLAQDYSEQPMFVPQISSILKLLI